LRYGAERHTGKVGQPPETLAAQFNLRADGLSSASRPRPRSGFVSRHAGLSAKKERKSSFVAV
jgi:hypothetical protein